MITLEGCANSIKSAITAEQGGAVRVELCDNLAEGGITPTHEVIDQARQLLNIDLFVLIRPRSGDFVYNDAEYNTIIKDIRFCAKVGCNGVVIGILDKDGYIDIDRNQKLANLAHQLGMECTFHRAIDRCNNIIGSLELIIDMGFDRILTSGGYPTAVEGADIIRQLITKANNRISIMPGSGITENNIHHLAQLTGLKEFHGSFRSLQKTAIDNSVETDDGSYANELLLTNIDKVKKAIEEANK